MQAIAVPLSGVVERLVRELDQIESVYYKCRSHSSVVGYIEYLPTEEGCLFALWDAWTRFLRDLVMTSSAGVVLGLSGATYVPTSVRSEREVLKHLRDNRRGMNFKIVNEEPNWHLPQSLSDIVASLGLSNASVIIGAVTTSVVTLGPIAVQSPVEEIRIARNFCAHKNWKTRADISTYSSSFSTLSAHLRERRSGVEAFSEWKECIESIAASAAQ